MNIFALLLKVFSGNKTRIVVSERSILSKSLQSHGLFERSIFKFLIKFLYPKADAIIAISESCANDLAKISHLSKKRISVIYNPLLNNSYFGKFTPEQEVIYSKLIDDKDNGNFIIIGIGRLKKVKNFS